jgi:hypothetical protein
MPTPPRSPFEVLQSTLDAATTASRILESSAVAEYLASTREMQSGIAKLLDARSTVGKHLAEVAKVHDYSKLFEVTSEAQTLAKLLPSYDFAKLLPTYEFSAVSSLLAFDASKWLPVYDLNQAAHAAHSLGQRFEAIAKATSLAGVFDQFEQIQPIIERYEAALVDAPDVAAKRLTFREAIEAVVEVAAKIHLGAKTPKEKFKNYLAILYVLYAIWSSYALSVSHAQLAQGISDSRRVQGEQAVAVATLTEAVRQLREQVLRRESAPVLRVPSCAILRVGPDGSTARVATVKTGQRLKMLARYKRWYYVEMLTDEGTATAIRGWVYKRNVRLTNESMDH